MLNKQDFYIDGAWVPPAHENPPAYQVINPATEQPVATISLGNEDDVNKAVAAARRAYPIFSQYNHATRLDLLKSLQSVYQKRKSDIAEAIMLELGSPSRLAHGAQSGAGAHHLKGFIKAFERLETDYHLPNGDWILREPIGVCGLITPWNWPINQIALKVFPALAVGCTVVLKPSELTPLNAMIMAEIIEEAGYPAGVFNLVNGDGEGVGSALSRHPDIDMISFTGSTRAGRAVTRDAAETIKRVTLELGGKSPNLVFADANLTERVPSCVRHVFQNTGQSCNAPTRMLVERSVYDQVVALAQQTAKEQSVGMPDEKGAHIGPLISRDQFNKVQVLIQSGIDEGARLVAGGLGKPAGCQTGYFVKPTVFADVDNQMRIAQEEIFGPVLSIIPFDTEAEAIQIANDTPYGLAAQIQTGDTERAKRVARALKAGMVHINGIDINAGSPFGGYKQSGIGREGGIFGLEDYLEVKAVSGV